MPILPRTPITTRDAARRYGLNHATLARWARRGLVVILAPAKGPGHPQYLDEASVERLSKLYLKDPGRGKRTVRLNSFKSY